MEYIKSFEGYRKVSLLYGVQDEEENKSKSLDIKKLIKEGKDFYEKYEKINDILKKECMSIIKPYLDTNNYSEAKQKLHDFFDGDDDIFHARLDIISLINKLQKEFEKK